MEIGGDTLEGPISGLETGGSGQKAGLWTRWVEKCSECRERLRAGFHLLDSVNVASMGYRLNNYCLPFQGIDCSPVANTKLESSFQFTRQRLRGDALEVLRKPGEPCQNSSCYWAIKLLEVLCCSLGSLNLDQFCSVPHDGEFCVRDSPAAFSVRV